jgi:histidinol-phosphate aminotransferase
MPSPASRSVDDVLDRLRPAVRNERPYVVGAPDDIEVKLNQNESPFDLPGDLKQELADAFAGIELNRYPGEQPIRLRNALAEFNGVAPESIIVGNGSNELTYTFGQAFLDPGSPVVLPTPMFSLYEKVARLCGADLTSVPPREDLAFDVDALVEAVRRTDPALTVLTSPNNPTGRALPLEAVERVVAAASGAVVVDEAYVEFNPEGTALELLDDHPNVILLRTFSKAFGLAGIRLGYLIAHPDLAAELMKARLPFMVSRFAERVGLAVLDRAELLERRVERMSASIEALTEALEARPEVEVVPSAANFVLFSTPLPSGELQERLAEHDVLIRDMSGYDELQGYVRVSAGTQQENKAFLAALDTTLRTIGAEPRA